MKKLMLATVALGLLTSPTMAKMPPYMKIISSEKFNDNGNEGSYAKGYTAVIKSNFVDGSAPWIMDYVISCSDPDEGPSIYSQFKDGDTIRENNFKINYKAGPGSNAERTDFAIWVHFCKK